MDAAIPGFERSRGLSFCASEDRDLKGRFGREISWGSIRRGGAPEPHRIAGVRRSASTWRSTTTGCARSVRLDTIRALHAADDARIARTSGLVSTTGSEPRHPHHTRAPRSPRCEHHDDLYPWPQPRSVRRAQSARLTCRRTTQLPIAKVSSYALIGRRVLDCIAFTRNRRDTSSARLSSLVWRGVISQVSGSGC